MIVARVRPRTPSYRRRSCAGIAAWSRISGPTRDGPGRPPLPDEVTALIERVCITRSWRRPGRWSFGGPLQIAVGSQPGGDGAGPVLGDRQVGACIPTGNLMFLAVGFQYRSPDAFWPSRTRAPSDRPVIPSAESADCRTPRREQVG